MNEGSPGRRKVPQRRNGIWPRIYQEALREPGVSKDHCLEYGLPGWTWLFRALRAPVMIKAPTVFHAGPEGPNSS